MSVEQSFSRKLGWLSVLCLGLSSSACAKRFVLVEYAERPSLPASVVEAQLNPDPSRVLARGVAVVGFLFPEHCGFALQTELASPCGAWSRELTRAFSEGGYRVLPVSELAHAYRATSTPLQAAKQLGADVLFSVGKVDINLATERHAQTSYYQSNAKGERLQPLVPSEQLQAWTSRYLGARSGRSGTDQVLTAFEAVATHIASGAVVWSFRGSKLIATQPYMRGALLMRGRAERYRPVLPERAEMDVLPNSTAISATQAIEHGVALLTLEALTSFQASQSE